MERQFLNTDSSIARFVGRPETRMKEIAPAEALFLTTLKEHPELLFIIRTNSKGLVVNSVSRENRSPSFTGDASDSAWYSVVQKTMKPYYSPLVQDKGKQYMLLWSRPIRVTNEWGTSRFGGVVAVAIAVEEFFKRFAGTLSGPFQVLLDGKELYGRKGDPAAVLLEKAVRIPGVSGLTCKVVSIKTPLPSVAAHPDTAHAVSITTKGNQEMQAPAPAVATVKPSVAPQQSGQEAHAFGNDASGPADTEHDPVTILWKMRLYGTAAIVVVFIGVVALSRQRKKQKTRLVAAAEQPTAMDDAFRPESPLQSRQRSIAVEIADELQAQSKRGEAPEEEASPSFSVKDTAQEPVVTAVDGEKPGAPPEAEVTEELRADRGAADISARVLSEEEASLKEEVREQRYQEIKREVQEKETNDLRNAVITELKTDIRRKLEEHEAEAIRAALQQELTDAWRQEIKEKNYEELYKKELENLAKVIREKLIEKEMPLLVESHRVELSNEIRKKMAAAFSEQIEQHERNALKADIVKKLQLDEYPHLLQEEREKLRASLQRHISENETPMLEEQAREELTGRIRTQMLAETETVREQVRLEIKEKLARRIMEEEQGALAAGVRDEITRRIRDEISQKERKAIHDRLLLEAIEEQRARIATQELQQVIETERRRIAEHEAPALREQVRAQLREEEMEAMHARVKSELYAETIKAVQENLEEKYKNILEKRMADFQVRLDKQVRTDIQAALQSEYRDLIEHVEHLSGSLVKVDALDSLTQTITLLTDEKKKYKYFNLNSAQTESLLEYLKRVHGRFNIFLDKVDEAVREMELKINSVLNKLNNGS